MMRKIQGMLDIASEDTGPKRHQRAHDPQGDCTCRKSLTAEPRAGLVGADHERVTAAIVHQTLHRCKTTPQLKSSSPRQQTRAFQHQQHETAATALTRTQQITSLMSVQLVAPVPT
jgi:hypothetical protein